MADDFILLVTFGEQKQTWKHILPQCLSKQKWKPKKQRTDTKALCCRLFYTILLRKGQQNIGQYKVGWSFWPLLEKVQTRTLNFGNNVSKSWPTPCLLFISRLLEFDALSAKMTLFNSLAQLATWHVWRGLNFLKTFKTQSMAAAQMKKKEGDAGYKGVGPPISTGCPAKTQAGIKT